MVPLAAVSVFPKIRRGFHAAGQQNPQVQIEPVNLIPGIVFSDKPHPVL
jgi:hypothetical protein